MALSIKQKQVLGVTSIVVLVVLVLSAMQLTTLTRTLLQQSRDRAELIAMSIGHSVAELKVTEETAYQQLRRDPRVQTALETALYSDDVVYAAILDRDGIVIAHSDRSRIGERLTEGDDLGVLAEAGAFAQLQAVYQTERMLEWRQPLLLGDLSRLGQGDLGATLDLKGDEFKELGDVFASVTNQLRAAIPDSGKRAQLLELSRRVTALGRLTAGVAHEVKNPLNAMTIHLELLKQKLVGGATVSAMEPHVDIISREIRRLDDVVQGFLKFARPEELTLKPIPPGELIDDVLKTLAVEANVTGVALESAIAPDVPPIEADAGIFRQALLNLAKNAVQAMPNGGTLTMSATPSKDGRVELRITDTGVGIPPENLAKIFDLYFTTKQSGTGIGLSLVYRTVQLHNGDIDVESTPGVGTTFVIKMPKINVATIAEPQTPSLRAEAERLRKTS
jgi:signal transduction histidine kinase